MDVPLSNARAAVAQVLADMEEALYTKPTTTPIHWAVDETATTAGDKEAMDRLEANSAEAISWSGAQVLGVRQGASMGDGDARRTPVDARSERPEDNHSGGCGLSSVPAGTHAWVHFRFSAFLGYIWR